MSRRTRPALSRLAIVNRGEPAMRLINAVREWNNEDRHPRLCTIAVHTAVDRHAMFVREADEAILIGPDDPAHLGPSPYLDYSELERALRACRADAVWPGWGFVSEKAEFVQLCDRLGVTFVGPSAEVMRMLGDKIESKRLAERVGVPLAPWSGGPVADLAQAQRHAAEIGYPLMVKATSGGGGRGIRLVNTAEELPEAFERASSEGAKTAGDPTVFMEKAISGGRHVEVQIVADAAGTVWTLGVRDCSVQRRNQKVIEESASTALDAQQQRLLTDSAAALVKAAGYVNAGTVEFLYQPSQRLLSFLEVNTRLQVEHPVTEATTGVDIVKLQLHIASGGLLSEIAASAPSSRGHAIEARLTAEDPEQGFTPAPGRIEHLALPYGPGIRVDTGVAAGDVIPPQYDSMIAKVIAWGQNREEARARLHRALRQTSAVIDGGTTNKAFLLDLLQRPQIRAGEFDTTWLDTMMAGGYTPPRRLDVALLATAVQAHDEHVLRQQDRLYTSAERGRPEVGHEVWHQVDVRAAGQSYRLRVARTGKTRYRVVLDGADVVDADAVQVGRFERRLSLADRTFSVLAVAQGSDYLIEVDGAVHRISGGEAGLLRAPAPAMVVAISVRPGDRVTEGEVLAVVESMKLETALRAPLSGVVAEVLVPANTQVESGTKLIRLEPNPDEDAAPANADQRVNFGALAGLRPSDPGQAAADALARLRSLVLGFDIDDAEAVPLLAGLTEARERLAADDPGVLAGEMAVLGIFADLCALSRNRRVSRQSLPGDMVDGQVLNDEAAARNPQEYLYAFLRSRDAEAEGLPEAFRNRLRRALAHYGLAGDPLTESGGPELGAALYRMFLAHRRASAHATVVSALLHWRLEHPDSLPKQAGEGYRQALDSLVTATQLRHPVVGDLARQVRYRLFDAPLIADAAAMVRHEVREQLDHLSANPATRAAQLDKMVSSGEPILSAFSDRHHPQLLEVMTRRYYQIRPLRRLDVVVIDGRPLLSADYSHDGQDYTVLATVVDSTASNENPTAPAPVADDLHRMVAALPAGHIASIDLYVTSDHTAGVEPNARASRIRDRLGTLPDRVERVAVAVRRADGEHQGPIWFTFRAGPGNAPVEDRTLRGMHPMAAERLGLWRLSGFRLTKLVSAPDVHLFDAQGREVAEDRRLIAFGDVRDLTMLRDEDGRIRGVPQLEQALDACLDSLRAARTADPTAAKLSWNRVLLYVWPVVDVSLNELDAVVRSLAPRTDDLGLEQVMVQFRFGSPQAPKELMLRMSRPPGAGLTIRITEPPTEPLRELDSYTQKVIRAARRGGVYPYELVSLLTRNPDVAGEQPQGNDPRYGQPGTFTEYDLDGTTAVPVDRAPGRNTASLVMGVVNTPTERYPAGIRRVVLLGDPTKALGALAEPECARVIAAVALARQLDAPIEWFAVSSGAKIAFDSGTENMDWISRVLRAIIEFTQDGGEINVVVSGINVGAQPYWNAEATMLMHTKGILVMTPDSTMVLTGKQTLDYSGGVSAEDNFGIGGYDRIMGPNGQAQYWAPDLSGAVDILLAHYAHAYRAPGERFPRPAPSTDPHDRDISDSPHDGDGFVRVGEVFGAATNGERKKPFDIRSVMNAVSDADHAPLERWADMHDADSVVVYDAHLGGQPLCLVGVESRPLPRRGRPPVDGPSQWTAGTLFPRSSKKMARAINAASDNRPLVVLANLSGFDGSPESLRALQLEYGAEIGRAVVNFAGPIVFCVLSRYHGGAFVVFSGTLNDNMEVAAVEGSYASVLGGAPAAAVVFAGEVNKRTSADPAVAALEERLAAAAKRDQTEVPRLRTELAELRSAVRSVKLGEVATEFDTLHNIERAQRVGSVDRIVAPTRLRPYLIDAIQRGMTRSQ